VRKLLPEQVMALVDQHRCLLRFSGEPQVNVLLNMALTLR
jgi:K+-transporting ATPase c subunit